MTTKGYLLLFLAGIHDLLENAPTPSDTYRAVYGYAPYKPKNLYPVISRMLNDKQIEKTERDGVACFRITNRGLKDAEEIIPLERLRLKWDGYWRMVIFDIEEKWKKDRDRVRSVLKDLGFAMLQESSWITPFPIENELISHLSKIRVSGEVLVTKTKILSGDIRSIVDRVWKLDELDDKYRELTEEIEDGKINTLSEAAHWELRFLDILAEDPLLPEQLLPKQWYGNSAKKVYKNTIKTILSRPVDKRDKRLFQKLLK